RPIRTAGEARDALKRPVTSPVRREESMRSMLADGVDTFVEVGPGRVLGGLARRIAGAARVLQVEDPAGLEAAVAALAPAGRS
ncbi:MAG: ACP S-malonyltransferase, partial [Acidobacteria bacterium]|nr:ACP S-malonyltransferase [Acidobacteriota bacterium]